MAQLSSAYRARKTCSRTARLPHWRHCEPAELVLYATTMAPGTRRHARVLADLRVSPASQCTSGT